MAPSQPYAPHDYQKAAIKFVVSRPVAGLFLDPGLGKTSIMYAAFKVLKAKGMARRMLVIAPLRPCYQVWPGEAGKWEDFTDLKVAVLHGPNKEAVLRSDADVFVINPEGLPWLERAAAKQLRARYFNLLVVDECFPAGTKVTTVNGEKLIENIKPGEHVLTSVGLREVLESGTRVVSKLVRLHFMNGASLECTPEHPIFTDIGWVPAKWCQGRQVYARSDLPGLWQSLPSDDARDTSWRLTKDLFEILRSETDVENAHAAAQKKDQQDGVGFLLRPTIVEQGTTLARGSSKEDLRSGESGGPNVHCSWWEWNRDDEVREDRPTTFAENVRVELRGRVGPTARELSYLLQARLCSPHEKDRTGGGRCEPSTNRAEKVGPEKGAKAGATWVARVEDLERSNTTVYNLRVEGCPHFFAAGVLVHNSTRFKHANTQRFKTLKPLLPFFDRRYILTGSPAPNGLIDLFGQIFILDLGHTLGQYVTHYRMAYFDSVGYGGFTYVPRKGAQETIYEKLRPLVLRMSAQDYLDLPPYISNTVTVTLPDKARRIYDQMEAQLLASVEDEVVVAANAAAATGKCRQIANGGIYQGSGEKREALHVHEEKLDAVEEIIEELQGKPALVAYEYEHDLVRLRDRFGGKTPHIGGGVGTARFREIESDWNAGRIPILLAQPQSVAHGLNLQGTGAAVIFHSLTWDLENYEQLIRRVWRQGQKERVVVHHIVAQNTVDEVIMQMVKRKDRTQRALLDALKTHLRRTK